jgi:hypothetical protein
MLEFLVLAGVGLFLLLFVTPVLTYVCGKMWQFGVLQAKRQFKRDHPNPTRAKEEGKDEQASGAGA